MSFVKVIMFGNSFYEHKEVINTKACLGHILPYRNSSPKYESSHNFLAFPDVYTIVLNGTHKVHPNSG